MNLESQLKRAQLAATPHLEDQKQTQGDPDAAAQKQLEHQLRKEKIAVEEKLRNYITFLTESAHDLRAPFSVIMGYSEMFMSGQHKANGEDYTSEYATSIYTSSQYLFNLINDLLDMCAIDAEKLDLFEALISVDEIIENAHTMISARAETANLNFVISVAPDLPLIFVDTHRINQAIVNVLSNAVKFTKSTGRIDLCAFKNASGHLEIHVSDDGIGINKKAIPKILTEFGKAQQGHRPCTGIGLPLAKRLVELHGGSLEISSEVDRGTKITILLPSGRWHNHTQ